MGNIIIFTGLGGKADKLRYCFVIRSFDAQPISLKNKDKIKNQFDRTCEQLHSELEEVFSQGNYFKAQVLAPIDVAIGTVIEEGIRNCNKEESCLQVHYYVTNVSEPTAQEIADYLNEIKDEFY